MTEDNIILISVLVFFGWGLYLLYKIIRDCDHDDEPYPDDIFYLVKCKKCGRIELDKS